MEGLIKMGKNPTEPSLMRNYFGQDTKTHDLVAGIRRGIANGRMPKFRDSTIKSVQREVNKKILAIDRSTYPSAQDLDHLVLSGEKRRVVLLVTGSFYGRGEGIDSVLGFDLGINPNMLFDKKYPNDTIDSRVSFDMTQGYITRNLSELMGRGFEVFNVKNSAFFYISDAPLRSFERGGEVYMPALVPLLVSTSHVGLTPVSVPSFEGYSASGIMPFTSYRLKASLADKLLFRLGFGEIHEKNAIRDWASNRIVVDTEEEATRLFEYLKSSPTIGRRSASKVKYLKDMEGATKDYYAKPEESGYRAFHMPVSVTTKGHCAVLREIQIVDSFQYYRNEVNSKDPAHHSHQKKKRDHIKSSGDANCPIAEAQRVLGLALGQNNFFIEVRPY